MAGPSSSTPFLADNDHDNDRDHDHDEGYDDEEVHLSKSAPANSYFKRPIKLLSAITSLLSILTIGLLIASVVLIEIGDFSSKSDAKDAIRDLSICLGVNFIVTTPTLFVQIPILINIIVNTTMSIVILVFSSQIFGRGWPDDYFCRRWDRGGPPDYRWGPLPDTPECKKGRGIVRITMGVAAGVSILIGITMLITLLLRLIALFKTKFWERWDNVFRGYKGLSWKPRGFTVQFTLSVLPHEPRDSAPPHTPVAILSSVDDQGKLIDT